MRYERFGFLSIANFLPEQRVQTLLSEAKRLKDQAEAEHTREAFYEEESQELRSLFAVHKLSEEIFDTLKDPRIIEYVSTILDDDVYLHQSRLNFKPAFSGKEFFWHSDFETWHAEDGMPRMRALSLSISLTPTLSTNGPLMLIPGSHKTYVSCAGRTPESHYLSSLVRQKCGTPDEETLKDLVQTKGISAPSGGAGSITFFDCNAMHGSNGNITPFPRTNLFVVYNAVSNRLSTPFAAEKPRPEFVAARENIERIQGNQTQ
ncbi:MAG: ectoine hydroxylase [Pseudohongiella sp.]|nr:MAG: ectoine hydroxylase [Pseudohongiella sp.]